MSTELGLFGDFGDDLRAAYLDLIHVGHLERSFDWLDRKFVVRTLKVDEEVLIGQITKPYNDTFTQEKAAMAATVAACLVSIDGKQPFPQPLEKISNLDFIRRKFQIILQNWHFPVVRKICEQYLILDEEASKKISEIENLSLEDQTES